MIVEVFLQILNCWKTALQLEPYYGNMVGGFGSINTAYLTHTPAQSQLGRLKNKVWKRIMFSGCEIAGTYNNNNEYMPGTRLSFVLVVELSQWKQRSWKGYRYVYIYIYNKYIK